MSYAKQPLRVAHYNCVLENIRTDLIIVGDAKLLEYGSDHYEYPGYTTFVYKGDNVCIHEYCTEPIDSRFGGCKRHGGRTANLICNISNTIYYKDVKRYCSESKLESLGLSPNHFGYGVSRIWGFIQY